jgi:hypothetical protein
MQLGVDVKRTAMAALVFVAALAAPGNGIARAADLVWEVDNPFRLYRHARSFKLHEDAFKAVRGADNDPLPKDVVQRLEQCLNDPDPRGRATPAACAANSRERARSHPPRLGWAVHTYEDTCFDRGARPRRYRESCERETSSGLVREDYVLPAAHTVSVGLSPERLRDVADGTCAWRWQPRAGGAWSEPASRSCRERFVIARVPHSRDRARSGAAVEVTLPDSRTLTDADVAVEDLLVVALGDSFGSGEGNPDRPVTFSARRAMDYRLPVPEAVVASMDGRGRGRMRQPAFALADDRKYDPYVLPRRLMEDEQKGEQYDLRTEQFRRAFWAQSEIWLSPDCHRSQYAAPFRAALQLALEDRHRAVTLVHLSCSGAEITKGLFLPLDAREHYDPAKAKTAAVPAQFDQLTDLICRGGARTESNPYLLPMFEPGARRTDQSVRMKWCPPAQRKRDIDLVLLSIGGNDVGFGALAAYTFLDGAGDLAALARVREGRLRFGPSVAQSYLDALDMRLDATRKALEAGFGVGPSRVVHTSYEPVQYDEGNRLCGSDPVRATLGMDVHAKFKFNAERTREVADFVDRLFKRLQCMTERGPGCPQALRTGDGTRFTLVTEHQAEFLRRGVCALGPSDLGGLATRMPRIAIGATEFSPSSPADFRPYAFRTRLFRTPNDAFLTAHTHAGGQIPLFDILQPAIAALYSGAFHPTAQGHAVVADHVMPHARRVIERRPQ